MGRRRAQADGTVNVVGVSALMVVALFVVVLAVSVLGRVLA
jgi:hypothetical protein